MKRTGLLIFSCALGTMAIIDSRAAPILCKAGFSCPIVAGLGNKGTAHNYSSGTYEGTWTATGPWGAGAASITIYGNSRCSDTQGSPAPAAGGYCWCQMKNGIYVGAWMFLYNFSEASLCATYCADFCGYEVHYYSAFCTKVCTPPIESCDNTKIIAEGSCPAGYARCVGSGSGSNAAGDYSITCSE